MEGSVTQCLCLLVSVLKRQKYTAAPRNILGGLFLPAAEPRRNQLKFRTEINWQELELFTGASHGIPASHLAPAAAIIGIRAAF